MRLSTRRTRALMALALTGVAVLAFAAPATAAPARGVHIVSNVTFDPDGNFGDFDASGAAVGAGLICASGTFVDTGLAFHGFQSGHGVQIYVAKTFTCPGSGTFDVKMQINANPDGTETFGWSITGGSGAYANLRGAGSGSTVPTFDTDHPDEQIGNVNTYSGVLTR
jgi:hypothetical protein